MEDTISKGEYRPTLTSPEGILMLFIACIADIALPILFIALDILFGVGEALRVIADIFFTILFSIWMLARGGKGTMGSKLKQFVKKRLGWMLLDYVPFLGDVLPSWIIVVVQFLKENE